MSENVRKITLLILTALLISVISVHSSPGPKFAVYGSKGCPDCRAVLKELEEIYGNETVLFFDISINENLDKAFRIVDLVPLGERTPASPLVGVFWDDKLVAITFGYMPQSSWFELLNETDRDFVPVIWEGEIVGKIRDKGAISALSKLFLGKEEEVPPGESEGREESLRSLLPGVILAAAADSVNPCVFSIFVVLIVLSIQAAGRQRGTQLGLAFLVTVYLSYFSLGLGLRTLLSGLLSAHSWILVVIGLAAISLGCYEVFSALVTPFKSVLPGPIKRMTAEKVEEIGTKASLVGAFGLGVLLSITLLPCSWGPYLVTVGLIARLPFEKQVLVLLLYNFIFVLPLIAVLILLNFFGVKLRTLKYWRGTKYPLMKLIAGILLVGVGIYAVLQYMP